MAAATAEAPRVGTEVRLHVGDRAFRGRVFCWDPQSDAAVLEEPHPQSTLKQDLRIVRLSLVDRVEQLAPPEGAPAALPHVPEAVLAKREAEGLKRAQRRAERVQAGVSEQAQILFNTLDKTYSLSWRGQDMVTELGITIKPPYTPESCTGKDAAALERIKKVVMTINRRIEAGEIKLSDS